MMETWVGNQRKQLNSFDIEVFIELNCFVNETLINFNLQVDSFISYYHVFWDWDILDVFFSLLSFPEHRSCLKKMQMGYCYVLQIKDTDTEHQFQRWFWSSCQLIGLYSSELQSSVCHRIGWILVSHLFGNLNKLKSNRE